MKYEKCTRDALKVSAQLGVLEMLRAGITTVGEVMDVGTGLGGHAGVRPSGRRLSGSLWTGRSDGARSIAGASGEGGGSPQAGDVNPAGWPVAPCAIHRFKEAL